jgi:bifunctional DNA-binding transcriptional regulator/antitoxin component of YhaV-PrlF toxin-antitoxin module
MRLLSQKSREYNGKEYRKFWVVIPKKIIERIGWKSGQNLKTEIIGDRLVIKKE